MSEGFNTISIDWMWTGEPVPLDHCWVKGLHETYRLDMIKLAKLANINDGR